nr:AMP-binding protein [Rhodococcus opacus]
MFPPGLDWVAGTQVARGYWNGRNPDAFADGYLHTGDLGAVIDDELYVVGRLKDQIIIRGRNFYPHDIELTAQSTHPAVRPGGAPHSRFPALTPTGSWSSPRSGNHCPTLSARSARRSSVSTKSQWRTWY